MPRGTEFRRRAHDCYRLSTRLQHPEHRSFALDLAKSWMGLAEYAERKGPAQNAAVRGATAARCDDLDDRSIGDGATA